MFQIIDRKNETVYFTGTTQEQATRWADALLTTVTGFNLMSAMNEMQAQGCQWPQEDYGVFDSKFTIPLYFVNLLLKDYNLKMVQN